MGAVHRFTWVSYITTIAPGFCPLHFFFDEEHCITVALNILLLLYALITFILHLAAVQGIFDEIQGRNAHFMKCWASGDFKSLSEIYTEDCKILATGCDTQLGRQGMQSCFSTTFKLKRNN